MYIIYLISDINVLEYVGKTDVTLELRLKKHRKDKKYGKYCSSSKLDLVKCDIIELEQCDDSIAQQREQFWMDHYPNRVNDYNAIENKDKRK